MFNKLIGEARGIFNKITIIGLLVSIIYVTIGVIMYSNPQMSNTLVSIIVGMLFMLKGLSSIYSYFNRGSIILFNNNLIYGIILMIIGLISIFMGNTLTIILAIYFGFLGIQKINYGIFLKKFNESSWLFTLVIGILYFVVAIVTVLTDSDALVKVTAICIIAYGIIDFIHISLLRKRSKYFIA